MKINRTLINLICSVLVLIVNTIITFWLSPYIVSHIGVEANGFVSLANTFVTYANLIVTALNAMAARFITIAYTQKDYKKANLYYNSVFYGNLMIVGILFIPAIILIVYFENVFDVPVDILFDVKILFGFIFLSFFLTTAAPNWEVGCYVTNRLDRGYLPEAIITIFKSGIIIGTMTIFIPKVWFLGIAVLISTIFMLCVNCYNTHKLTPKLKICLEEKHIVCSISAIRELVGSGLWSSVSNMGNILLSGLDLIVCNALLGAKAMGVLAISKTLANLLQQLSISLTRSFSAELTIDYANGNQERLKSNIFRSMKITATIMTIATAGCLIFGESFFRLWIPSQDAKTLSILAISSFLGYIFTSGTQILYNVFNTVNKVKQSAIAQLSSGIASIILTVLLVKFTSVGIYAVALVSTICSFIRNMLFTIPMSAHYLGFKKTTFYPMVLKTFLSTSIISLISFLVIYFAAPNSWLYFALEVVGVSSIGFILNIFVMLSKSDRKFLLYKVKQKFSKR